MKKTYLSALIIVFYSLVITSCDDTKNINTDDQTTLSDENYSHIFQQSNSPALPEGQTIQDVVNALNKESKSANGLFYVTGNSWAITCDENYYWKADQDPEWGAESTSSTGRSTIVLYWFNGAWITELDPNYHLSLNNHPYPDIPFIANVFLAGCWPIESE